ncbi:hypothetical protein [Burkholderia lata]|uniref:hypothetical protein n=1 Tax=Burkholderia lata (strain ATCC 17760 / DSM 23089 / LMG 22485 / NCIMB 9086 / R18194 / 383) TaxID=482957 RepID=UPI003CC62283
MTFFRAGGGLDDVDSSVVPDGRSIDYSEWISSSESENADSLELLSEVERNALPVILEQVFESRVLPVHVPGSVET